MDSLVKQETNLFSDIYRGKKVLVTGDTGFKGSWLSIWLNHLGAEVYGFALPPKTPDDNFIRCGLKDIIHHRDGDVRDSHALLKFVQEVKPDIAFHLAAQALVLDSYKNPSETFETNVMGTVRFFEAVRLTPSVKAAVNVTSDKCYQNNEWVWGYRENDPMGGSDPYSASKGASEIITSSYLASYFNSEQTCHVASARAGNVIGGGDWSDDRIVPDIFRALNSDQKVIIRNPNATRPWQYVLEPLRGYLMLAAKLYRDGKTFSGAWNFGPESHACYSVLQVVQEITKKAGKGSYEVLGTKGMPHEAKLLRLDISKATQYLGWQPSLSFDETIDYTVTGYQDERNGGDVHAKRVDQIDRYAQKSQLDFQ